MSPERDCYRDMARGSLDYRTTERLLSGQLAPDDAPPGYQQVSELVIAARSPAVPVELARETSVVSMAAAATRAVSRSETTPARQSHPRRTMSSKLLTAKALAVATVATLGVGTAAAAASGSLPSHASSAAKTHASPRTSTPSTANSTATTTAGAASHTVNPQAVFGLCTAYLAQHSTPAAASPSDQSTSFKALIGTHGGNTGTWTYCNTYVTANHPGRNSTSTTSTTSTTAAPTSPTTAAPTSPTTGGTSHASPGKPSSAGSGHSEAPVAAPNPGGTNTANTASSGASDHGTSTAATHSHGASTAGSANSTNHRGGH